MIHRTRQNNLCSVFYFLLLLIFFYVFSAYNSKLKEAHRGKVVDRTTIDFENALAKKSRTRTENPYTELSKLTDDISKQKTIYRIMKNYKTYNSYNNYGFKPNGTKYILFWNEAYGSKDYGIGFGSEGFRRIKCPISDCFGTDNRSYFNSPKQFDAVVFHFRTFNDQDLPSARSSKQRWIFWSLESPQYNMKDIYPINGLFNWTMTYRVSSDIVQPYGWLEPLTSLDLNPPSLKKIIYASRSHDVPSSFLKNKTKLVAWFVSNCHSKSLREKYVEALMKHVDVDVYGDCGSLRCDKGNTEECYKMLDDNYKFYLSFENSFCDDYVTEKLFSIMKLNVVPIVFGGANYSAIAPPFSFIDAKNFRTARHLAAYLKFLDRNSDYYTQYFWWKPLFRVRNHQDDLKLSMCGLCSKLHTDKTTKVYDDMEKWWTQDSHCFTPRQDNVFRVPYWS